MTKAQITCANELAELRTAVATLTAELDQLRRAQATPQRRTGGSQRRRLGLLGAVVCAGLLLVGVAGATPTTSTTDVAITPLTVGHKVLSNASIAANKTTSPVVAGGSTTVPTNATTVQLTVTAKGSKAGVLNFYPAGNPSGGSGQTLAYPAGSVSATTTIQENIGQSDELTVANAGAASVVVTATLTGFSTQVTAGDIGNTGGSTGQVLTDNGRGANWQDPGGTALSIQTFDNQGDLNPVSATTVASLTVPMGSYYVSWSGFGESHSGTPDILTCFIFAPGSQELGEGRTTIEPDATFGSMSVQGVLFRQAGTISLQCESSSGVGFIADGQLTAVQVRLALNLAPAARRPLRPNLVTK